MGSTRTRKTEKGHTRPPAEVRPARDDAAATDIRWRVGPRTQAWDDLWRWLLDGLLIVPESGRPASSDDHET